MMKKRNTVDLPEELVAEILSRVPAISLARFRSISKGWNSLIKDGEFAKKHLANAPRPSLFIMFNDLYRIHLLNLNLNGMVTSQISLKDPLDNSLYEGDICDVFQCDGLLVCATNDDRLVVWNPCSGETKWIQPRNSYKQGFYYYALGKSSCNKYKILRMCRYLNPLQTEYEVYDFASGSWKRVGKTRDSCYIRWSQRCGVSLKGTTYWLACNHQYWRDDDCLLNFDFSTETFQSQNIPLSTFHVRVAALSVVREEQLCLLLTRPDIKYSLDVWMATKSESTRVMSWSKFLTANPSYQFSHGLSFLPDEHNKVVLCRDGTNVANNILHIVGEDRHIQVDHHGAESSYSRLLSYVPTLTQIPQVI